MIHSLFSLTGIAAIIGKFCQKGLDFMSNEYYDNFLKDDQGLIHCLNCSRVFTDFAPFYAHIEYCAKPRGIHSQKQEVDDPYSFMSEDYDMEEYLLQQNEDNTYISVNHRVPRDIFNRKRFKKDFIMMDQVQQDFITDFAKTLTPEQKRRTCFYCCETCHTYKYFEKHWQTCEARIGTQNKWKPKKQLPMKLIPQRASEVRMLDPRCPADEEPRKGMPKCCITLWKMLRASPKILPVVICPKCSKEFLVYKHMSISKPKDEWLTEPDRDLTSAAEALGIW